MSKGDPNVKRSPYADEPLAQYKDLRVIQGQGKFNIPPLTLSYSIAVINIEDAVIPPTFTDSNGNTTPLYATPTGGFSYDNDAPLLAPTICVDVVGANDLVEITYIQLGTG